MPMESKNKMRASNSRKEANGEVQLLPELLMAARGGNWSILNDLLNREDAPALVVDIEIKVADTTANMGVGVEIEVADITANMGVGVEIEVADTTANMGVDKPAHPTEGAATIGLDSILHEVASSGDGEDFMKSADVIYGWAKHLLDAHNKKGDTPLQCAARTGRIAMVRHLIALAREDGGVARVKVVLRNQNRQGETALHEALRLADKKMVNEMVEVLMSADAELARFTHADGTSPLYLAVMLGHNDIAEKLYQKDKELSYSGPDGQNVLHVAVLRSKDMTEKLLNWNLNLIKQRDTTGSTPLHVAASWGRGNEEVIIKLLLDSRYDRDKSSTFQKDNSGSFPIHVAAVSISSSVVRILLNKYPSCAGLQDAKGRTFLHIAVKKELSSVVKYACWHKCFAPILNIQDNDGNTALHLAAEVGSQWSFYHLIQNPQVHLNLLNSKGQTPMDIAWMKKPRGVFYGLDPRIRIFKLLQVAGAEYGTYRWDLFHEKHIPRLDQKEEAQKITDSTQIMGVGSVLIATVAFAAAFTLPGGYRADDHKNGGTPTLAGQYAFDVFIIANTLAFICSGLSIISLIYAGVATVDIRTRMNSFIFSVAFMSSSARSLGAAFAFGLYVVLAPVSRTTAIASCAITALALIIESVWFIWMLATGEVMLLKRLGIRAWCRLACAIPSILLFQFWPFVVIAGLLTYSKITRVH